jgi:hypothetical protein
LDFDIFEDKLIGWFEVVEEGVFGRAKIGFTYL